MDSTTRYIAAVAGVIIIAIIAIILIFNRNPNTDSSQNRGPARLTQYATEDSFVTLTTEGRMTGDDTYRSIRITVTPEERRIEILRGYENEVEREQTFENTQAAYESFLAALDRAGFALTKETRISSPKGVCPLGKRYLYTLDVNGDKEVNSWATSCSRADGNANGTGPLIRSLFQAQITDYGDFVRGVRI